MSSRPSRECEKLRQRLPELAEGTLGGPDRDRIARHLAQCPHCSAELEDLRTVIHAVRAIPPDELPEDLIPRLRRAVSQRVPDRIAAPQLWVRVAIPVAMGTTCLLALSFALRAPRSRGLLESHRTAALTAEAPVPQDSAPGRAAGGRARAMPGGGALGVEGAAREESRRQLPLARHERPDQLGAPGVSFAHEPLTGGTGAEREVAPPAEGVAGPAGLPGAAQEDAAAARPGGRGGGVAGVRGEGRGAPRAYGGPPIPRARRGFYDSTRRDSDPARPGDEAREEETASERAALKLAVTEADDAAPPPFSAQAVQTMDRPRAQIALQLAAKERQADVAVNVIQQGTQQLLWRGPAPNEAPILLSAEQTGPGPAAIPVTIESPAGKRNYVLFIPTMSRLGETAPAAPTGAYEGQPLSTVLAEFSALTGLVVLAEEPLTQKVTGSRPEGPPHAALEEIALSNGFEVEQLGDVVFNLSQHR